MKKSTTSMALFLLLLPAVIMAQQAQPVATSAGKAVFNDSYYVKKRVARPAYLYKGEEKVSKVVNQRGFLTPQTKAIFEPYPNAYQKILLSEQHYRKAFKWNMVTLGIGTAGIIYNFTTRRNVLEYKYGVDVAGTALVVGSTIMLIHYYIKGDDARNAAVKDLNKRQ